MNLRAQLCRIEECGVGAMYVVVRLLEVEATSKFCNTTVPFRYTPRCVLTCGVFCPIIRMCSLCIMYHVYGGQVPLLVVLYRTEQGKRTGRTAAYPRK